MPDLKSFGPQQLEHMIAEATRRALGAIEDTCTEAAEHVRIAAEGLRDLPRDGNDLLQVSTALLVGEVDVARHPNAAALRMRGASLSFEFEQVSSLNVNFGGRYFLSDIPPGPYRVVVALIPRPVPHPVEEKLR